MSKNGNKGQNGHGHVTETPDVSHIKNLDVTHETSDVNVLGIVKFVVALTLLGIIVQLLMWGMFRFFNAQEKEPQPGPMAMNKAERLPPEPRLQAAPGFGVKLKTGEMVGLELKEPDAEYKVLREQWEHQLYCRETDQAHEASATGPPCTSINAAIEKLFTGGGLPVRAAEKESGKSSELALPTAASSGRVTGFK